MMLAVTAIRLSMSSDQQTRAMFSLRHSPHNRLTIAASLRSVVTFYLLHWVVAMQLAGSGLRPRSIHVKHSCIRRL